MRGHLLLPGYGDEFLAQTKTGVECMHGLMPANDLLEGQIYTDAAEGTLETVFQKAAEAGELGNLKYILGLLSDQEGGLILTAALVHGIDSYFEKVQGGTVVNHGEYGHRLRISVDKPGVVIGRLALSEENATTYRELPVGEQIEGPLVRLSTAPMLGGLAVLRRRRHKLELQTLVDRGTGEPNVKLELYKPQR